MTPAQVQAEHERAIGALTDAQITAIERLQRARAMGDHTGKHWRDCLAAIFAVEAEMRSDPKAGHA